MKDSICLELGLVSTMYMFCEAKLAFLKGTYVGACHATVGFAENQQNRSVLMSDINSIPQIPEMHSFLLSRIISRSEKDLASLDSGFHEPGSEESHAVAKLSTKVKTRGSIPFGSTESIESSHSGEQMIEIPDKVVRLYRADQTFKYFPIFQVISNQSEKSIVLIQGSHWSYLPCAQVAEDSFWDTKAHLPGILLSSI